MTQQLISKCYRLLSNSTYRSSGAIVKIEILTDTCRSNYRLYQLVQQALRHGDFVETDQRGSPGCEPQGHTEETKDLTPHECIRNE